MANVGRGDVMQMTSARRYTKKQWNIAIIAIVVVIAIALVLINNPPKNVTTVGTTSTSALSNGHISSSQYDQIKTGMSYDKVKQLIGSGGESIFESGDKGTEGYQISYMWKGKSGGEATISFSGTNELKVLMKSQSGLK